MSLKNTEDVDRKALEGKKKTPTYLITLTQPLFVLYIFSFLVLLLLLLLLNRIVIILDIQFCILFFIEHKHFYVLQ